MWWRKERKNPRLTTGIPKKAVWYPAFFATSPMVVSLAGSPEAEAVHMKARMKYGEAIPVNNR